MEAIISFPISHLFNILNSILLHFVPNKLLSLLPISRFFLTKTESPPPQPDPEPEPETEMDPSELKRVFQMFDRNGDGRISQKELSDSLRNLGISIPEEEVNTMIQRIDVNKDECVDLEEFEELYRTIMAEKEGGDEADLREAFQVFDRDGDGFITSDELNVVMESLKQGKTIEECKLMIGTVDSDGDGRVDYKEFIQMMRGGRFMGSS